MIEVAKIEIPKAYDPKEVEDKWYKYWQDHQLYHAEIDETKEPYTIVIPPPNITGILHLGHVLNNTLQDVYIRYKRMLGFNALWVPGSDHASIATEAKVVNHLKELGFNKFDIGREKFLEYCREWQQKYGGIINAQLKKLGVSCDWERERFTMDDEYYKRVIEAFVKLHKKGLIYRGYRLVNWDPATKSAISDEEVNYRTINGKLWYFKYPVIDSKEFLIIATTRPETMLGDTAVAVNPEDERYKHLIGKKIKLPLVGREIPIIADEYVDLEFGTGAVKVTPAHDVNDYEMGLRHNLEIINIFNEEAVTNNNVPEDYIDMDRYEAREKIVADMEELGLLEKAEDYTNNVGYSQRGGVPIEPFLSEQWFMKMDELAEPALKVIQNKKINFHPEHWTKTYEHWMTNIRDWCISRQLWWGHRIPVWYNKKTDEIYCEAEPPEDIENWDQDKDVLDTWASSWLWAQDVFHTEEEQKYFYPTDLLVTGPDIIFFWVARMIMAGMEFMNDIPFKDVYFTSIIRDDKGRKMSKSLGNSPDPLDVIDEYGADALRFTINYISPAGQDVLFSPEKCEIGRNFANKIWNAARFLIMNAQNTQLDIKPGENDLEFTDKWIISRFNRTLKQMNDAMDRFDVTGATKIIYAYVWNDYCDWYVEMIKNRLYSGDEEVKKKALATAIILFEDMLKIVHPFMPFITEEIWQLLRKRKEGESISVTEFPEYEESKLNESIEEDVQFLQEVISSIRNIRGEMNIPPSQKIDVYLKTNKFKSEFEAYIKSLAKVENLVASEDLEKPRPSASSVVKGSEIFIPLAGIIDLDVEKKRIEKEIARLEGVIKGTDKKLTNKSFLEKAPTDVVEREKKKRDDWKNSLEKLKHILSDLS